MRQLLPLAKITGVEIDPEVVEVGRRFFDLPSDVRVVLGDARSALSSSPLAEEKETYDVIIVDAFQFPYVPFQLCTVEFFRELERRLSPGGAIVVNVGRDEDGRDVVYAIARTMSTVMAVVRGVDVPSHPNTMLVATRHDPTADAGLQASGYSANVVSKLTPLPTPKTLSIPPNTPVFTDDHAPVEAITDSLVLRRVLSLMRHGWS
jgi:spermidine synthase